MPLEAHQLALRYPNGDLVLDHARILEEEEQFDREHSRPPFSDHVYAEGTGKLHPPTISVVVILREASLAEADLVLEALESAAASCTQIMRGEYKRVVHGLASDGDDGGALTISPTLKGYRVEFDLVAEAGDWEAWDGVLQ